MRGKENIFVRYDIRRIGSNKTNANDNSLFAKLAALAANSNQESGEGEAVAA
jgi:hypothetical protein